jgi:hypothetical protein
MPPKTHIVAETFKPKDDPMLDRLACAVCALLRDVPDEERREILRRVAAPEKPERPATVLGTVIEIFRRNKDHRRDWTVAELRDAVAAEGVAAPAKTVHNALGYLSRKRRIQQIAYGRYLFLDEGAMLVTTEDMDVEPIQHDE